MCMVSLWWPEDNSVETGSFELRSPDLCGKCLYPMNQLAGLVLISCWIHIIMATGKLLQQVRCSWRMQVTSDTSLGTIYYPDPFCTASSLCFFTMTWRLYSSTPSHWGTRPSQLPCLPVVLSGIMGTADAGHQVQKSSRFCSLIFDYTSHLTFLPNWITELQ